MMRIKTQLSGALFQASTVTGTEVIKQTDRHDLLGKSYRSVCLVEMAGIEPASERFDPRNSTSVACRILSSQGSRRAGNPVTICWS